jgi:hypothetical protein
MKHGYLFIATTIAALATLSGAAEASKHSIYVHGRTSGVPSAWTYWTTARPGVDAKPANWSGYDYISTTNASLRTVLNANCCGNDSSGVAQQCYLSCHSAGCGQVGYALDQY